MHRFISEVWVPEKKAPVIISMLLFGPETIGVRDQTETAIKSGGWGLTSGMLVSGLKGEWL